MQCNREKSCEFRGLNKCIIHSNDDGWVYYKQAYVLLAALEIFFKFFCPSFSESSGWKIGSVCLCVYNTFVSPELNLKEMSHDEYSWLKDDPYCFEVKRLRSLVHVIRNHLQMLSPILFKISLEVYISKMMKSMTIRMKMSKVTSSHLCGNKLSLDISDIKI